jgi:hypothetical protein
MFESECQLSYFSFRSFVECSGKQASHCVNDDHYVRQTPSGKSCYDKEGSALFLCDYCLAFWWECIEHREHGTWETALFFRDLLDPRHENHLGEFHIHLD